jgi:diguanylate cyclase (GGDEF)-like protein/PAS domain S-box-containing protein
MLGDLAVPSAASAAIALLCGIAVIVRERFSRMGWLHLLLALSVFGWQFSVAGMLSARTAETARLWITPTIVAAVFVPAAYFHFTYSLTRRRESVLDASVIIWAVTAVFAVLFLSGDAFVTLMIRYRWGFYPRYGLTGYAFIAFTMWAICACVWLFARVIRDHPRGGAIWRRNRLLLVALGTASLGALDFLPALGFDIFPVGGFFVVLAFTLNIYTTWRYRLVEITPALAAQQFMDTMSDGILVIDRDGMVRLVNRAACEILGYPDFELLHVAPPAPVAALLFGERAADGFPVEAVAAQERRYQLPNFGARTLSVSLSFVQQKDDDPIAAVVTLQDRTASVAAQDEIHRLAYYDALTGLPNRVLLKERFTQAIAWAERSGHKAAVLFLDLDRFKHINDTLGHDAGDQLLQAVAERITQCVRESDIVVRGAQEGSSRSTLARLGGDEFVLLLSPIEQGEDAARVALRIIEVLGEPIRLRQGEDAVTGVSIGIALYPGDGIDADTLLKKADIAMYHAKESGRNTVRFHDTAFNELATSKIGMETSLRRAVMGHEFLLRYQPIVSSVTGAAVAIDTQVCWNHPVKGLIPEREFRDAAHDAGVVPGLNEWVIRTACLQMQSWQASGMPRAAIMVSIGAGTVERGRLVETVREALAQTGLSPSSLWLCVQPLRTKSAMPVKAPSVLRALNGMGVRVVLDDFGAGQISLDELLSHSIAMVRMEGEWLGKLPGDPQAAVAVRSLLTLASGLGIDAVACGVDTPEASRFLRDSGCDYLVGRAHSPAVTAEEVLEHFDTVVVH